MLVFLSFSFLVLIIQVLICFFFSIQVLNQKIVNVKGFSPRYTAPEVFGRMMSNSAIIPIEDEMKSDVYSYSIILWEMMARKIPWSNCIFFFLCYFIFFFMSLIFILFLFPKMKCSERNSRNRFSYSIRKKRTNSR